MSWTSSFASEWLRRLALVSLLLTVAACGGGETADLQGSAARDLSVPEARAADTSSASSGTETDAIDVVGLTKVSERRLTRTQWEYVFRVSVRNRGLDAEGVALTLTAAGAGSTVVDGSVALAAIPAGNTVVAGDTVTLRHERSLPFDSAALRWNAQVAQVSTQVALRSSVPAIARDRIVEFVSPDGEAPPGGRIRMEPGDQGNLAVGINAAGEMMIAALLWQPVTEFSAETTAVALIQLAIGPATLPLAPGAIDAAARTTATFPSLVEAIQRTLDEGQPVAQSTAVPALLLSAASETAARIEADRASAAGSAVPVTERARALSLAPSRVNTPLPFTLHSVSVETRLIDVASFRIRLGQEADERVTLSNALPAHFDVAVSDPDGIPLLQQQLPMFRFEPVSLFTLALWGDGRVVPLTVPGNRHFNVRLWQSTSSKALTWRKLWVSALATLVGKRLGKPECSLSSPAASAAERLIQETVPDDQVSLTTDLLRDTQFVLGYIALLPQTCVNSVSALGKQLASLTGIFTKWFLNPLQYFDYGTLAAEFAFVGYTFFYPIDKTYGVCRDASGRVRNCVKRFEFDPAEAYAATNSRFYPDRDVRAVDESGSFVGLPAGIQFSLVPSQSASLSPFGDFSTSSVPGTATVTVKDPDTAAEGSGLIRVVKPVLNLSTITVPRSLPTPLFLVDPTTRATLDWASFTVWTVDRQDAFLVDVPAWVPLIPKDPDISKLFGASATGVYRVTATNVFSDWSSTAEIIVVEDVMTTGTLDGRSPIVWAKHCDAGSYSFTGNWSVRHSLDGSTFSYDLREVLSAPCLNQDIHLMDEFPLSPAPSNDPRTVRLVGSKTYPFSSPAVGRKILSAEVFIQGTSVTGWFRWDHLNTCCDNQLSGVGSTALVQTP